MRFRVSSILKSLPLLVALPFLAVPPALSQTWETAANNPGDPTFVQLPYEVVFVSSPIVETGTCTWTDSSGVQHVEPRGVYQIGTDVLAATRPSQGNELWVVTRDGAVKKLFPLPVHETQTAIHPDSGLPVPLIDTPTGMLHKGSVVEPNVSEDGKRVILGYFHDTTFHVGSGQGKVAKQGADLYVIDLSSMVESATPNLVDPATLPVRRLTFKEYDSSGAQSDADKNKDAMNPVAAATSGNNGWGTVYIHGTEMRTRHGLKMVYVSGERRNMNSNEALDTKSNYNLNLHIANIENDGSLGASRQFQYYTTTSAMSPTPLRNGIAFSYQATTGDGRNWHIQHSDSEGRWGPLIGYGTNPDLFHLGAFCVDTVGDGQGNGPGDYFIGTKYYNLNNNGFGALWKIDLDELGINTYDNPTQWGDKPAQKSARKISLNVTDNDFPSGKDASGQYYGKLTTPSCGRPNELLFAYTPTSANGKSATCEPNEGNNIYRSYIGYRPNLGDFNPITDILKLVQDSSNNVTLTWVKAMLDWFERTGDVQQETAPSIIGRRSVVTPGKPFAQVGASSIYNTDRKPYDCWLGTLEGCPNCCGVQQQGQTYYGYNPNKLKNNQKEQIWNNFDGLSYVQDPNDFCKDLDPSAVLGIEVNITSNRIKHNVDSLGYQTDGSGKKETVRVLGVYDVRDQADQSFQALIPSHTPFEFHLLDRKYGMRLVDVRSWHSLYPREVRTNCGGCHQHEEGKGQPFQGTVAQGQPPLDMVSQTQTVTYDPQCNPTVVVDTTQAAASIPEWKMDIWPQFDQYCGNCHNNGVSTNAPALAALSYANESQAYNQLKSKNYANSNSGALGSPAFWAARGERTDGRDNALYQPGAVCESSPTYAYSRGHDMNPNLCGQNNGVMAAWVHRLGQWIDNHMPRDTGHSYDALHDRYHPAADIAVVDKFCQASKVRVGYWDDSGLLAKVEVLVDGVPLAPPVINVFNGSHVLNGLSLANGNRLRVIAEDEAGNRQVYEKKVKELKDDCKPKIIAVPGDPLPLP